VTLSSLSRGFELSQRITVIHAAYLQIDRTRSPLLLLEMVVVVVVRLL
jgi:hypothetical protein